MNGGDALRPVNRGRGNPLDRASADVADREYPFPACFERERGHLHRRSENHGCRNLRPEATSQSVLGSAPMKENRKRTVHADAPYRARSRSRMAFERTARAAERGNFRAGNDGTLGRLSMRSTRYCDIVSRNGRRATMVTLPARLARKTVACPAELPPPTSATSWPCTGPLRAAMPSNGPSPLELFQASTSSRRYRAPVARRRCGPGCARQWRDRYGTGHSRIRASPLRREWRPRPRISALG